MQTRRDFLEALLGTVSLAVAGPLLNSCTFIREEVRFEKALFRYETTAHEFLDIEAGLGVTGSDYQALDDMIYETQKRIKVKPEYTKKEAINVLETIDVILEDWGFEYKRNTLLNQGLKNKKIDCDNYSVIYVGIAEALKLPLKAVRAPMHVFVRWRFNNGECMNWETISAKERPDEYYKLWLRISEESIKKGVFLRSLSRKEFCSVAYHNRGFALRKLGKDEEAIKSYDKAIKLNPNYPEVYNNKGYVLYKLGRYEEAISNFNKALELNPNYFKARCSKEIALKKLLEKR